MGPDSIFQDDDEQKKRPQLISRVAPPSMGAPALNVPPIGANQKELNRLTAPGTEDAKPGWQQISNPVGRTFAGIGSTALGILAPRIAGMVPGTTAHHDALVNQQESQLNQDALRQEKNAQSGHLNAETEQIQHPQPKSPSNEVELFNESPDKLEAFYSAKEGHQPEKGVANPQAGYAQAIADALKNNRDPNTDPHVQAWRGAIEATQKESAGNRDDKAIAINQKLAMKQPLSPEEVAYKKAYDQYVKQNKVDPGVQRMEILTNSRMLPTVEDGGRTVYTPARQAAGKESPQSIPFQTEKSVAKAFTSGPESKTLNAFNTAHEHLQQFGQAADALQNGNIQVVNQIANNYSAATGNPAPTNFNAIRAAVAGEISKTFKGTGAATDDEIKQINDTINRAQSPQQLKGAIQTYTRLMESKRHALETQYQQGLQGKPSFGADVNQGGGMINVQIPGHPPGQIPAGARDQFLQENPGAKVIP
jgi:hypothetical protein